MLLFTFLLRYLFTFLFFLEANFSCLTSPFLFVVFWGTKVKSQLKPISLSLVSSILRTVLIIPSKNPWLISLLIYNYKKIKNKTEAIKNKFMNACMALEWVSSVSRICLYLYVPNAISITSIACLLFDGE